MAKARKAARTIGPNAHARSQRLHLVRQIGARVRRDTRGRVFAGPGPSRSAVPEAQPETAANAFAAELAERLDGFIQRRAFDRLILVAPARTLTRLRPRLQASAKAVVGEHAKDLTKLPVSTLLKALDALSLVPQPERI